MPPKRTEGSRTRCGGSVTPSRRLRHGTAAYARYRRLGEVEAAVACCRLARHRPQVELRRPGGCRRVGGPGRAAGCWTRRASARSAGSVLIARAYRHPDRELAERLTRAARACAEGTDADLELVAMSQLGRLLVGRGEEGFGLLDEAVTASLAGEGVHLDTVAYTCCDMLVACELAGDLLRAALWRAQVDGFVERYGCPFLAAECRLAYGSTLLAAGRWGRGCGAAADRGRAGCGRRTRPHRAGQGPAGDAAGAPWRPGNGRGAAGHGRYVSRCRARRCRSRPGARRALCRAGARRIPPRLSNPTPGPRCWH